MVSYRNGGAASLKGFCLCHLPPCSCFIGKGGFWLVDRSQTPITFFLLVMGLRVFLVRSLGAWSLCLFKGLLIKIKNFLNFLNFFFLNTPPFSLPKLSSAVSGLQINFFLNFFVATIVWNL